MMRKKKKKYVVPVKIIDQTFDMHTGLPVCVERKHMSKGSRGMTHAGGPVSTVGPINRPMRVEHGCNNVTSLMLDAMVRYG